MVLKERPIGEDKASYAWCAKCDGFVIALGKHCIENDSHLIDFLSPKERKEVNEALEKRFPSNNPTLHGWGKPKSSEEIEKIAPRSPLTNGPKIKAYRKKHGISREKLSQKIGVSVQTLGLWETGKADPTRGHAKNSYREVYGKLLQIIEEQEKNPDPDHEWKKEWETSTEIHVEKITIPAPTKIQSKIPLNFVPKIVKKESMEYSALEKLHSELCQAARNLMEKKNHDYRGGTGDPFANFRASQNLGIDPKLGILIRVSDKLARIATFINKGTLQVQDESVRDTVLDMINYSVLLMGMVEESK